MTNMGLEPIRGTEPGNIFKPYNSMVPALCIATVFDLFAKLNNTGELPSALLCKYENLLARLKPEPAPFLYSPSGKRTIW